jgi:hypothetical protein
MCDGVVIVTVGARSGATVSSDTNHESVYHFRRQHWTFEEREMYSLIAYFMQDC